MQSADKMLLFDCPWNWARLQQRIDRIHRIGQDKKVQVIFLTSKDTIDEKVLETIMKKKDMFDKLVQSPQQVEELVMTYI
jgi:SNF2 family DNA or RNA helicase